MTKITPPEGLQTMRTKKRFGKRYSYGDAVFGESEFGDDGIFGWVYGFGKAQFGGSEYGSDDELTGIYQTGHWKGRTHTHRLSFYWPNPARNAAQDASRIKFAAGVAAYKILSAEEKLIWHRQAVGFPMSGYNLFLKNFMITT